MLYIYKSNRFLMVNNRFLSTFFFRGIIDKKYITNNKINIYRYDEYENMYMMFEKESTNVDLKRIRKSGIEIIKTDESLETQMKGLMEKFSISNIAIDNGVSRYIKQYSCYSVVMLGQELRMSIEWVQKNKDLNICVIGTKDDVEEVSHIIKGVTYFSDLDYYSLCMLVHKAQNIIGYKWVR